MFETRSHGTAAECLAVGPVRNPQLTKRKKEVTQRLPCVRIRRLFIYHHFIQQHQTPAVRTVTLPYSGSLSSPLNCRPTYVVGSQFGGARRWHTYVVGSQFGGARRWHTYVVGSQFGGARRWHTYVVGSQFGGARRWHTYVVGSQFGGARRWHTYVVRTYFVTVSVCTQVMGHNLLLVHLPGEEFRLNVVTSLIP